jgi:hypothetical protein
VSLSLSPQVIPCSGSGKTLGSVKIAHSKAVIGVGLSEISEPEPEWSLERTEPDFWACSGRPDCKAIKFGSANVRTRVVRIRFGSD